MITLIKTDEDVAKANAVLIDALQGWIDELKTGRRSVVSFIVDVSNVTTETRIVMSNQKEQIQ